MNFDNFTIKSQEAIQKAVEIVRNHNEQSIEPVHLLKGILQVGESLTSYLFKIGSQRRVTKQPSRQRNRIASESERR